MTAEAVLNKHRHRFWNLHTSQRQRVRDYQEPGFHPSPEQSWRCVYAKLVDDGSLAAAGKRLHVKPVTLGIQNFTDIDW